jgi:hypothetical protein
VRRHYLHLYSSALKLVRLSRVVATFMNHSDPYIFSRGSLKLTYDLLRKVNPGLALTIRNITSTEPLPKLKGDVDNPLTDCFKIELDSFQVRAVVEGIISRGQQEASAQGIAVVAQALAEDWLALAHAMIAELSESAEIGSAEVGSNESERSEKKRP